MLTCFKINGFPLISERTEMKTTINEILLKNKALVSMAEGRRLVSDQAIKLNGFPVQNLNMEHEFHVGDIIQVGKKIKVVIENAQICTEKRFDVL
jgi:tyrosyl-tRNA synthetase